MKNGTYLYDEKTGSLNALYKFPIIIIIIIIIIMRRPISIYLSGGPGEA